jgi:hypothetical protein
MGGDEGQTGEQGADTITLRVREQTGDEMFFKVWLRHIFWEYDSFRDVFLRICRLRRGQR